MWKFSDNHTFKRLLDEKKQDIFQRISDGVQETSQFQRLLSLLSECRRKNEENDFRVIIISKSELSKLSDTADENAAELFRDTRFLTNRITYVDSKLGILDSNNDPFPEDNDEARMFFTSLSTTKDWIVFHVAPNALIKYFIDGKGFGGGVFYTSEAQKNYEQLKTIDHLPEVLNEYRISLTHQNTYLKFFVTKAGLRAMHRIKNTTEREDVFLAKYRHLLNNKPEYLFQEDMRNFINQHMRVFVTREEILEDLDRLDIKLTDERGEDTYFIEIKWVGESIAPDGSKPGTEYEANPRIKPDAVRQVVGYIAELLKERQNIKIGYLAVFDARKDDLPDTGEGITEADVPEEFRKYYPRFVKLKDFRVKNENPR